MIPDPLQKIIAQHVEAVNADTERLERAAQLAKQELPKGDTSNPFLCWVIANHWRPGIPAVADDDRAARHDLDALHRHWSMNK